MKPREVVKINPKSFRDFPPEKSSNPKVYTIPRPYGVLWFYGTSAGRTIKIIGDTGAGISVVGGNIIKQYKEGRRELKWKQTEKNLRVTGPTGEDMKIIGKPKIDIEIGGIGFQIECVGAEGLTPDLLLSYNFLKEN